MNNKYPQTVPEDFKPHWNLTISNEEYHSDPTSVSSTGLKMIHKSQRSFYSYHVLGKRPEKTKALNFGSAFHEALLEPHLFNEKFVVSPKFTGEGSMKKKIDWRSSLAPNATILTEDEYKDLEGMLESIQRHREASSLLKKGVAEISGYFRDPETGIKCRIRPDLMHQGLDAMLDVKTTRSCEMSDFSKEIWNMKYYMQMAMYCLGMEMIEGRKVHYPLYLAVEKNEPYEVAIYMADDIMIQKGMEEFRSAMSKLKNCIDTDQWESYQTRHQPISLPRWATINEGSIYE